MQQRPRRSSRPQRSGAQRTAAPPIFVIGSGRSGTSLLRAMLNAHPRIYLLQEASFLPWIVSFPAHLDHEGRLDAYFETFGFAWTGLDPRAVRAALPRPLPSMGAAFEEIMRQKARQRGRVRYGEKNPVNTLVLRRLFREFPDARVINVVRDPRAVVLSQTTMPWSSRSLSYLCWQMWLGERMVGLHRDRILSIRLEDLTARPRDTLHKVLEYLDEPWDEAVLTPFDPDDDGIPFPWLRVGARRTPNRARWEWDLPPTWIRHIERACADMMEHFGYPAAQLEREPSTWQMIAAVLRDLPALMESLMRVSYATLRTRHGVDAATGQQIFLNLNPSAWRAHPDWHVPAPPRIDPSSSDDPA